MRQISKKILCLFTASCFCITCGCSLRDNTKNIETQNVETSEEKEEQTKEKVAPTNAKLSYEEENVELKKENKVINETKQASATNTDIFEKVDADCIFSIGINCRPCSHLMALNMRFQAAPLDWMIVNSLDVVAHLFETKFEDFFEEIKESPSKATSKYRTVQDTKNHISSIHHFEKNSSLEEEHQKFRETMLQLADKVDEILQDSSSIALISNRTNASTEDFVKFIKRFSAIYPDKKITVINVKHSDIADVKKEILFDEANLKVIQYAFNDSHTTKSDTEQWKGNMEMWSSVISSINLGDKFATEEQRKKTDF